MEDRITTAEAADIIGITGATLKCWRAQQKKSQPPYYKIGGKVFYSRKKTIAWFENQLVSES